MNKSHLAETIAEITNLKVLEIYRKSDSGLFSSKEVDRQLVDLGTRITEALDLLPNEDKPAELPANKIPPARAPTDTGNGSQFISQPPIGGGELPSKKEPVLKTGTLNGNPEPGKPAPLHPVAVRMQRIINENEASPDWMARIVGVTPPTVRNLLKGARPRKKTASKIRIRLDAYEKDGQVGSSKPGKKKPSKLRKKAMLAATPPAPKIPDKVNGSTGKGPIQFIQLKLGAWMGREHLGNKEAAERLDVFESWIRDIQNGKMPSKAMLRLLGRHIPDIGNNLHDLIAQSNAQSKAQ